MAGPIWAGPDERAWETTVLTLVDRYYDIIVIIGTVCCVLERGYATRDQPDGIGSPLGIMPTYRVGRTRLQHAGGSGKYQLGLGVPP